MSLITAYGGSLRPNLCPEQEREAMIRATASHPAHSLSPAQIADLEALMLGAYSPLSGYMGEADYQSVLSTGHLTDGTPWPVPVTLAVASSLAESLGPGAELVLRDEEGTPLALMTVAEQWQPDKSAEAEALLGSRDPELAAVGALLAEPPVYLGGKIVGIQLPKHYDFTAFRATPEQLRAQLGDRSGLGFWLTHPTAAGLEHQLAEAARNCGCTLVLGISAGSDLLDPMSYAVRARLARRLSERIAVAAKVQIMPMECRSGGVRDYLQRLLVMRNFGCAAVVLEAGSLDPETLAQLRAPAASMGVALVTLPERRYDADRQEWTEATAFHSRALFEHLLTGKAAEAWMIHPDDEAILRSAFPARAAQGVVLFFTGLSGAGKSTVAKALYAALGAYDKSVTLLDGDIVRLNLSKGLGFSKEDRDTNILRIGYVASLVARSGGMAICAPIAPYRKTRAAVRRMVGRAGRFVEVHVATDLATCESRDPKGLYARARSGQLKGFTGIDDPYEVPENPELRLDTGRLSVDASIQTLLDWLLREGYLS